MNIDKYGLAIHTNSGELGLSLNNFQGDNRQKIWDLGREMSTHLHQNLSEFIQPQTWQDLQFIAVAKGPGSFTSTRIGVVTARTIAQQLNLPLFGISTMEAIAFSQKDNYPENTIIAVEMEARRGELFVGIYQVDRQGENLKPYLADCTMKATDWQTTLNKLPTNYNLIRAPENLGFSSNSVLEIAYLNFQTGKQSHWSEILPFYGQDAI